MIELPRYFFTSVTTPVSTTDKTARFQAIAKDEQAPILAVERRRTPSRRKPGHNKPQIERRVSSDRRRTRFSSKA